MRQAENDGEHIWLRQSVTFTTNGQTRTVEIAIPLRPGATAEEVEVLLSEADAGMERLARHLDARIATALDTGATLPTHAAPALTASASVAPSQTPAAAAAAGPAAIPTPPPTPAAAPEAPRGSGSPAPREQPTRVPAAAAPPARPTAPPATHPATSGSANASASAPATPVADMSRPEFLAAARDLGMDARQAMQRLGVRSLEGLNLRKALEELQRQHVQGGGPEPAAASPSPGAAMASQSASAIARTPAPAPLPVPHGFDEEDEPEFTVTVDGSEPFDADDFAYAGAGSALAADGLSEDELDDVELDEVPDFAPPASRAGARPAQGRATPATAVPAPSARAEAETGTTLLARLREATGGGVASTQQRNAYRNMIVEELGEAKAASLVRAIWRVPPDRLGPDQMSELLSWGKRDAFGDEVALVLAELRAERDRAQSAAEPSPGSSAPRNASPNSASAPRPRGTARSADRAGGA